MCDLEPFSEIRSHIWLNTWSQLYHYFLHYHEKLPGTQLGNQVTA